MHNCFPLRSAPSRRRAVQTLGACLAAAYPVLGRAGQAAWPQGNPVGFVPWYGLFGPASMPPELVTRINALLNRWLVSPEAVAVFEQKQNTPAPTPRSSEAFAAQIQAELPVWRKMMQTAKIEGA